MDVVSKDIVILGGGRSGSRRAIEAGNAGRSVALIEKDDLGGDDARRGSYAMRLLLAHAATVNRVRTAAAYHVDAPLERVDSHRIFNDCLCAARRRDREIERALPENVEVYRGHGRLVAPHAVVVNGIRIEASEIVIATGSLPVVPESGILSALPHWTADDVFDLDRAPASITIVGGGASSIECADVFEALGSDVLLIARRTSLIPDEDIDVRTVFTDSFARRVPIRLGAEIVSARFDGKGFEFSIRDAYGGSIVRRSEKLLLAIGRRAATADIGLDAVGLETNEDGQIIGDARGSTSVGGVTAIGRCAIATRSANLALLTTPEVKTFGRTEDELRAANATFVKAIVRYDEVPGGGAEKDHAAFVKILAHPSGRLLGLHIVGPNAANAISAIRTPAGTEILVSTLAGMPPTPGSVADVVRAAAECVLSKLSNHR